MPRWLLATLHLLAPTVLHSISMDESESLFATMLEFADAQNSAQDVENSEKNREHLLRLQRIYDFQGMDYLLFYFIACF